MKLRKSTLYILAILMAAALSALPSCRRDSYRQCGGMVWNTVYNITYRGPESLQDSIMPVLNAVSASASVFDSLSLVSRINRGEDLPLDSTLLRLYRTSLRINRESGGKFDPTVGPLVTAWGFGKGHTPTADTLDIPTLLKYVGISKTHLRPDGRLAKDDPRLEFNFSAIAKGLGCDAVAEMLERNGVTDYMIEIGGEIRTGGRSPRGDRWRVQIDAPVAQADTVIHESQAIVTLENIGIATSGNYRNFHQEKGRKFGHTINPLTGRPATTDVASATVAAPTTMEADGYATAIMAMGSADARRMADSLHLAVYIVTTDGKVWMSESFKPLLNPHK